MSTSYEVPFEVPCAAYPEIVERLRTSQHLGIDPKLESVSDMLDEVGRPDSRFGCMQVAGTNGKTSTAFYTAGILAGEGLRVALYTSPELVSYAERMRVGGLPVSEELFAYGVSAAYEAGTHVNERRLASGEPLYDITEFDVLTVAAMVVFAKSGVDVAVLECGMGGRWDATSAVSTIRTVGVTGIGLDHTRILGDTLEKIAAEKAAIIKRGRTCVLGVGTATPYGVEDVFLKQCADQDVTPTLLRPAHLDDAVGEMAPGSPLVHRGVPRASYVVTHRPSRLGGDLGLNVTTPRSAYSGLSCTKPVYQAANIACAVLLAEAYLGCRLDLGALRRSIGICSVPGRFDVLSEAGAPLVMVDAAHNPQSVQTFLAALRDMEPRVAYRPQLLCAILADKDCAGIVHLLAHEFPRVSVCQTETSRALAAEDLAALFRSEGKEPAHIWSNVSSAIYALSNEPYVAVGSITLAGAVAGEFERASRRSVPLPCLSPQTCS